MFTFNFYELFLPVFVREKNVIIHITHRHYLLRLELDTCMAEVVAWAKYYEHDGKNTSNEVVTR